MYAAASYVCLASAGLTDFLAYCPTAESSDCTGARESLGLRGSTGEASSEACAELSRLLKLWLYFQVTLVRSLSPAQSSDLSAKEIATEIIREKLWQNLNQEIPYALEQVNIRALLGPPSMTSHGTLCFYCAVAHSMGDCQRRQIDGYAAFANSWMRRVGAAPWAKGKSCCIAICANRQFYFKQLSPRGVFSHPTHSEC